MNWKQIGHVLNRASQLVNMEGQKVSGGIFAPAISYNPYNKTYYMVTTNVGSKISLLRRKTRLVNGSTRHVAGGRRY